MKEDTRSLVESYNSLKWISVNMKEQRIKVLIDVEPPFLRQQNQCAYTADINWRETHL
ncbi:hypothetical protein M404DRAFT_1007935, partial [Pisolithus tinctorius Marx 270]